MKLAITTLATSVAALLTLGLVMLYSASMTQKGAHLLLTQIIWCAMGCAACVTATCLDYRLLKKWAWPIFIVAVVLLALVLVPQIGHRVNGARRGNTLFRVAADPRVKMGPLAAPNPGALSGPIGPSAPDRSRTFLTA